MLPSIVSGRHFNINIILLIIFPDFNTIQVFFIMISRLWNYHSHWLIVSVLLCLLFSSFFPLLFCWQYRLSLIKKKCMFYKNSRRFNNAWLLQDRSRHFTSKYVYLYTFEQIKSLIHENTKMAFECLPLESNKTKKWEIKTKTWKVKDFLVLASLYLKTNDNSRWSIQKGIHRDCLRIFNFFYQNFDRVSKESDP